MCKVQSGMQTILSMLRSSLSFVSKEIIFCPGYDVKLLNIEAFLVQMSQKGNLKGE